MKQTVEEWVIVLLIVGALILLWMHFFPPKYATSIAPTEELMYHGASISVYKGKDGCYVARNGLGQQVGKEDCRDVSGHNYDFSN